MPRVLRCSDFSNGFLVAEIFSRYYDKDVQMHSYDNGHSTASKKDNWAQLLKFFSKRGVLPGGEPVTQTQVDAIVHCRDGAAVAFINDIYELLSGRRVQKPPEAPVGDPTPAFAKPTASTVLRDSLLDPDMQTSDISASEAKMKEKLEAHEAGLQSQRLEDPARFAPRERMSSKVLRGSARTVGAEESKQSVTVKRVNVKTVDAANVAQLRATKEIAAQSARAGMSVTSGSRSVLAMGGDGDPAAMAAAMAAASVPTAVDVLNEVVLEELDGRDVVRTFDPRKPACVAFVDAVRGMDDFPEELTAAVIDAAAARSSDLADACAVRPKDFWSIVSVYTPLMIVLPEASPAFAAVADAYAALGRAMVTKDRSSGSGGSAQALFEDFALPKLCTLLRTHSEKRAAIIRVVYSFAGPDVEAHTQAIRSLQTTLDHLPTLMLCLVHCAHNETPLALSDKYLLDLYLYYCMIGMGMSSPSIRAASVGMLAVILAAKPDMGRRMLDHVAALQDDSWWETRAQVLVVCGTLLREVEEGDADGLSSRAQAIASAVLASASPPVARVGLAYLAPVLEAHPDLERPFLGALLALPGSVRENLLLAGEAAAPDALVDSGAASAFHLQPLPDTWPPLAIAQGLASIVAEDNLQNLEAEHFDVLVAALRGAPFGGGAPGDTQPWLDLFDQLKGFVVVALCDPVCAEQAISVLRTFTFNTERGADVLEANVRQSSVLGSLIIMHDGSDDDLCRSLAREFLSEVASQGGDFADAVRDLLARFRDTKPDKYASSPLKAVGDDVGV